MKDLALNPLTHDLDFSSGDLYFVDGDDYLVQKLRVRLQFLKGEWFLDQRVGIPYLQELLKKNPDPAIVRSVFRQAILSAPGIASLENFEMTYTSATRTLNLDFTAIKSDGTVLTFDEPFVVEL